MNENDLKRYTVILGGGSGVLFQPLDENITYILTAKHVLYKDIHDDRGQKIGEELIDKVDFSYSSDQSNKIKFEIKKGKNYFEHDDADAAILILNENLGYNEIFIDERTTSYSGFNLTGYPNIKRETDDKYDKYVIADVNSYNDNLIALRLVVNHLDHEQITGFSGGGIIKANGDSLLLAGIQSKTPIGNCNGEIQATPAKIFEEIVASNNLSKLLPNFFSKIDSLLSSIIEFNGTIPSLIPKLQGALRIQARKIKCELKDIYSSKLLNNSSIRGTSINSKYFWTCFLEYALIISLLEDNDFNEELLGVMNRKRKFIFSDSSKNIYDLYSDILLFASENIEDQCQILVATTTLPTTDKTRRMPTSKVPKNIANVDDNETIDRIILRNKIKEIIHLKAIELDCINKNDELLDQFDLHQFEDILTEIKRLVHEFFSN
mgnify:CR=1 FL=1